MVLSDFAGLAFDNGSLLIIVFFCKACDAIDGSLLGLGDHFGAGSINFGIFELPRELNYQGFPRDDDSR